MLSTANTLGLTTIAEGIEHGSQGEHLRRLGISYGQGYYYYYYYYYSPPLSPQASAISGERFVERTV